MEVQWLVIDKQDDRIVSIFNAKDNAIAHCGIKGYILPVLPGLSDAWIHNERHYMKDIPDRLKLSPSCLYSLIDCDTGKAIDEAVHPFAGLEEQIGIIRAQIGEILIELGLDPTEDFARLNEVANAAIQAAATKKEALDESSGSIESAAD